MFKVRGASRFLLSVIVYPEFENKRSHGTFDLGIEENDMKTLYNSGCLCFKFDMHVSMDDSLSKLASKKKLSNKVVASTVRVRWLSTSLLSKNENK